MTAIGATNHVSTSTNRIREEAPAPRAADVATAQAPHGPPPPVDTADLRPNSGSTAPARDAAPPLPAGEAAFDYAALAAEATPGARADRIAAVRVEDAKLEVSRADKVGTLAEVLPPDQAARLREMAATGTLSQEQIDAAYGQVLDARKTPGSKDVGFELQTTRTERVFGGESGDWEQTIANPPVRFQARLDVGNDGEVNGKALTVDATAQEAARYAIVPREQKARALRESGLSDAWLASTTDAQQDYALARIAQADKTPGAKANDLDFSVERSVWSGGDAGSMVNETVAGRVSLPAGELPGDRALREKLAFEAKEWPGGTPDARTKSRIEDVNLEVGRADKVSTLAEVLPPDQAARMRALVDGGRVPAAEIDAAYAQVLEARKTPGDKDIRFDLHEQRTETVFGGESGDWTRTVDEAPVSFGARVNVDAAGQVNGKALGVDRLARLSSEISSVPQEAKDAALRDVGLSEEWVTYATPAEKEMALAKIRDASTTPGAHDLDLSYNREVITGGEAEIRSTMTTPGRVRLDVGADGTVNGKPPAIETALATTLAFERMPMADKRQMMASLGVPEGAVARASPEEASDLLTRVSLRTQTPGEQQFEARIGGKDHIVGLKVGADGNIEGAGATEKPPKPPAWKKWVGPILSIASVVFPPAAPFLQAANAAFAVANGAKGLGLVAAVAGGVAGIANIAGAASVAASAQQVATVAGASHGVYNGVKNGDWLSAISSGAALVGAVGGESLGESLQTIRTVGTTAGVAARVANGDIEGLAVDGLSRGIQNARPADEVTTHGVDADEAGDADVPTFRVDLGAGGVRLGEGGGGVRLGTGDDGASLETPADEPAPSVHDERPIATQADVRRIDNEIAARVTDDFNRAFADARGAGQSSFLFDRQDGRGLRPFTTARADDPPTPPTRSAEPPTTSPTTSPATSPTTTATSATTAPALSDDLKAQAQQLRDRFVAQRAAENLNNRDVVNADRQRTLQEAARQAQGITDPVQRDLFVRELAVAAGDAAGRVSMRNRGVVSDVEALAALASPQTGAMVGAAAARSGSASEWRALSSRDGIVGQAAQSVMNAQNARFGEAAATAGKVIGGFLPGVGQVISAADFHESFEKGDNLGMTLAALGVLPFGRMGATARELADAGREFGDAARAAATAGREVPFVVRNLDDARVLGTGFSSRGATAYEGKLMNENLGLLQGAPGYEALATQVERNHGRLINGVVHDTAEGRVRVRIDFENTARSGTPKGLHYNVENLDTGAKASIQVGTGTMHQQQQQWLAELARLNKGR